MLPHSLRMTRYDRAVVKQADSEMWEPGSARIPSDSCAIFSGGLDSTTLVYDMLEHGYSPHLLSFNYGQRHAKELQYAAITAANLGLKHHIVDLRNITKLISNSALTSPPKIEAAEGDFGDLSHKKVYALDVPDGHYAEENMKLTVVPNRNMIMLSIAAGVMVSNNYKVLGFGAHAGDHFIYPDCRALFVEHMEYVIAEGNLGFGPFSEDAVALGATIDREYIYRPFIDKTKAEIAYRALELGVPLHLTWSCYKGSGKHCGRCGTCVERLEAIDQATARQGWRQRAEIPKDETEYEDTEFWKTQVRGHGTSTS